MRVANKILDLLFYALIVPILGVSVYAMIDANIVSKSAALSVDVQEYAAKDGDEVFDELDDDSKYIIAWLRIDDTNINYPVVQGEDNAWFLNRNYKGEFATAGSLFLDYRNNDSFMDRFSIIYGHRMGNGEMFSDIHKFEKQDYFNSHRSGTLKMRGINWRLEIVAYAEVNARD